MVNIGCCQPNNVRPTKLSIEKALTEGITELLKGAKYNNGKEGVIRTLLTTTPGKINGASLVNSKDLSLDFDLLSTQAPDCLAYGIQRSVSRYEHDKDAAIRVYKEFLAFLEKTYGLIFEVSFPEILVSNSLERQMEIVKLLHDPKMEKEELADRLWVSSRTIETDLARLSLDSNDPLDVMGQRLAVDMKKSKRKVEFPSKVHPFFLTFNLTQVIVTLEGLKVMSEKPGWRLYAVKTAQVMWKQLSKTARARIREVSEFMSLDIKWYEDLNNDKDNNLFRDEWMCSDGNDANSIMLCFKNGLNCDIQYRNDEGKDVIYLNCKILSYDWEIIKIKMNEEVFEMKIDRIVASKSSTNIKKDLNHNRYN